jgi:hypothetical protein
MLQLGNRVSFGDRAGQPDLTSRPLDAVPEDSKSTDWPAARS